AIQEHFARIAALSAFGTRKNGAVTVRISATDKKTRQQTEKVLALLGWGLHSSKNGVTVDPATKGDAAKKQETVSALAFDAQALIDGVGLKTLADKSAAPLERFAAALAVRKGRVAVPGGTAAEPIWTRQIGASPADPKQFLRALLERDHGQALAYYASIAQLD